MGTSARPPARRDGTPASAPLSRAERAARDVVVTVGGSGAAVLGAALAGLPNAVVVQALLAGCDGERNLAEAVALHVKATGHALSCPELEGVLKSLRCLARAGAVSLRYRTVLSRSTLAAAFRGLGLAAGDKVVVHSSLSSLGLVEGGAATVCQALMDTLTADGLLLMPSFNHYAAFAAGAPGYYSPIETPSRNGAISDCFWRLPGVLRSIDPSHPCAAWGRDARRFVATHHLAPTMDLGSPLQLLEAAGGKALLLDCPGSLTFYHVVEMTNDAPCTGKRTLEFPVRLHDGRMVKGRGWNWRDGACPVSEERVVDTAELPAFLGLGQGRWPRSFRIYDELHRDGRLRSAWIGLCPALLFRLADYRARLEPLLRGQVPGIAGCRDCPRRPQPHPARVDSDWDNAARGLLPGSTAYAGPYTG